ncbi:ATP-binding protein [Burkholderia multivorans]|uniref:ATP-binding protein n=1 Tax=Burkholderia multivorans TaxID=87883 RepID=UPI0035103572
MAFILLRASGLCLAVAVACLPPIAQGQPSDGTTPVFTPDEREWIARHPVVRVSFERDWPPIAYVRNGRMQGIAASYLEAVSGATGLRFELAPTKTWAEGNSALIDGKVDLIASLSSLSLPPLLEGRVLRTREYFISSTIVVGRSSQMSVFRLRDLYGHTVSVKRGGAIERLLRDRFVHIRMRLRDTTEETFLDVESGQADFALLCDCAAQPFPAYPHGTELQLSGPLADMPVILSMAVRQDDTTFKSILDKSLRAISVDQANTILQRWIGHTSYGSPPTLAAIARYRAKEVALLLLFVLVLVAATFYSHIYRRRAVLSEHNQLRLFAALSHDIRTPLNALIGSVDLLRQTVRPHEQAELQHIAGTASESLSALINDILAFSQLEAGEIRLHTTPTDVAELSRQTADMMRLRARDKGLALTVSPDTTLPDTLLIDAARVRQILYNLISNAIKFTESGAIAITLSFAPLDSPSGPGMLTLAVSDTGIGIAPADQAVIFDVFRQVELDSCKWHAGTGLGLSVCRMLAELMGGTITVHSSPGVGSVFTVVLPASAAALDASGHDAPPPAPRGDAVELSASGAQVPTHEHRRPVVLVVDDHRSNLAVLHRQIRSTGCVSMLAESGQQALELFSTRRFDLVLMDLNLGDFDGFTLTQLFRNIEAGTGSRTPIVSISASSDLDHQERALASGMDGLLEKPIHADALRTVISLWCDLDLRLPSHPSPVAAEGGAYLATTYSALLNADLDTLNAALINGDNTSALAIVHRIKGAAQVVGDAFTVNACARLHACLTGRCGNDECRRVLASLREQR